MPRTLDVPEARPPLEPCAPAQLSPDEAEDVKAALRKFYGETAIVRNYGPDPTWAMLHVEADEPYDHATYCDCMGVLLTKLDRRQISLHFTQRGHPARGLAKLAYRQGEVL